MTDRLEFDVGFDLGSAKAEAAAFRKQFDKPIEIKVKVDSKSAIGEVKRLQAELEKMKVGALTLAVDFDEKSVMRDLTRLKQFIEEEVGQIDIRADFDAAELAEQVRSAVRRVEKSAPRIKVGVDADPSFTGGVSSSGGGAGGGRGAPIGSGVGSRAQRLSDEEKIQNNILRIMQMRNSEALKEERTTEKIQANLLRLMEMRDRDERAAARAAAAADREVERAANAQERQRIADIKADLRLRNALEREIIKQLKIKEPNTAELLAINAKIQAQFPDIKQEIKLDVDRDLFSIFAGAKGGLPAEDVKNFLGAFTDAPKAGAQLVGLGNNFAALGKSGGPISAAVLAATAFGAAMAATPALVAVGAGAIAVLTGAFTTLGVVAATETQPVLDALRGINREGDSLKQKFSQGFGTSQAILGLSFEGVGEQIANDLFDPINKGLAQFSAGLAPSISRSLTTLTPVLDSIASTLAGPLGASLGRVTEGFADLIAGIEPLLTDGRLVRIFDQFAVAVEASGPGLNETVDLVLQLTENFLEVLPAAVELGTTLLKLTNVVYGLIGPLLEVNKGLFQLLDIAAKTSGLALVGDLVGMNDEAERGGEVFVPYTKNIEELGKKAGRAGFDVDKFSTQLFQFNKKNIAVLPEGIRRVADSIGVLADQANAGTISWDELQSAMNRLKAESGLDDDQFGLAFKAWETGAKEATAATEEAATALKELQDQLGELNSKLGDTTTSFADLAIEQRVFFGEALRDGVVSVEEFNAVLTATGLSSEQAFTVFDGIAEGVTAVRDAINETIPTFGDAIEAIDFTTIAFGRRTEAVLGKLKDDLNTTLVFLRDVKTAQERGVSPELLQAALSTGTFDQQRTIVRELAVGGTDQLAALEGTYREIIAAQQFAAAESERIAREVGVRLPEEITKSLKSAVPGVRAGIDEVAAGAREQTVIAFSPGNPANEEIARTIKEFFTGGKFTGPIGQAEADKIVADFAKLQKRLQDAAEPPESAKALAGATVAIGAFVAQINTALLPALGEVDQVVASLDELSATIDVDLNASAVFDVAHEVARTVFDLDSLVASPLVVIDVGAFNQQLVGIYAALDALSQRRVSVAVDIVGEPRKEGGPVLPGIGYPVNEQGRREGIVDDRGFRMLPPGGFQTFDRPGVIIPANEVSRYVDPMRSPTVATSATTTIDRSSRVEHKTVNVHGVGRDPRLVLKQVLRGL